MSSVGEDTNRGSASVGGVLTADHQEILNNNKAI
jgi:hypothetical protein